MNAAFSFHQFASIAASLFLEAAPFLALGAVLSGAVEVYWSGDRLSRLAPRHPALGALTGMAAGMVLPICECGVVPVARRFLVKGARPPVVFGYMLAAPVINPVVLAATWVAFNGDWRMTAARVAVVGTTAFGVAVSLGKIPPRAILARPAGGLENGPGSDGPPGGLHPLPMAREPRWRSVWRHAGAEFLDMSRFLILGAVVAALFKTLAPAQALVLVQEQSQPVSVAIMMALAVVLSICSEVDAFVANSLTMFPAAAQVAFTAIGPMLDLKLIAAYGLVFHKRLFLILLIVPTVMVFSLCTVLGLVW